MVFWIGMISVLWDGTLMWHSLVLHPWLVGVRSKLRYAQHHVTVDATRLAPLSRCGQHKELLWHFPHIFTSSKAVSNPWISVYTVLIFVWVCIVGPSVKKRTCNCRLWCVPAYIILSWLHPSLKSHFICCGNVVVVILVVRNNDCIEGLADMALSIVLRTDNTKL